MIPSGKGGSHSGSEELRMMWKLAGLAFTFGTEIIAGVLLGMGFDLWFGTSPTGTVIGATAGIVVAMSDFIRRAFQVNRQMSAQEKRQRLKGGGEPLVQSPRPESVENAQAPIDEGELTHEQWKALRDLGMEVDSPDDISPHTSGKRPADGDRRGD